MGVVSLLATIVGGMQAATRLSYENRCDVDKPGAGWEWCTFPFHTFGVLLHSFSHQVEPPLGYLSAPEPHQQLGSVVKSHPQNGPAFDN